MSRTAVVLILLLAGLLGYFWWSGQSDALAGVIASSAEGSSSSTARPSALPKVRPELWPPALGQAYPDLALLDRNGEAVHLSDFRGQVILLEPVGMNCPACQGFAGGNEKGAFGKVQVPQSVWSIENMLTSWGHGVALGDADLVYVQLLLYDMEMGPPVPRDAAAWDGHFEVTARGGHVLVPAGDLRNRATYDLIPGFQLIDRDFVLRWDASGHRPTHGYDDLLGGIRELL